MMFPARPFEASTEQTGIADGVKSTIRSWYPGTEMWYQMRPPVRGKEPYESLAYEMRLMFPAG